MASDVTLPEYDTVMVEDPVVVTVPSQSSTSGLDPAFVSFCHVAPPPLTEEIVTLTSFTLAASTSASPTFTGLTDRVEMPVPSACCNEPTAEIVPVDPPDVVADVVRRPSTL